MTEQEYTICAQCGEPLPADPDAVAIVDEFEDIHVWENTYIVRRVWKGRHFLHAGTCAQAWAAAHPLPYNPPPQ